MTHQKHDKWCWAAVAVSVAQYFQLPNAPTLCELAGKEKHPLNCCANATPCNETALLTSALGHAGIPALWRHGAPLVGGIHAEMAADLPLGWRCEWDDTKRSGHFAVISAVKPGNVDKVDVEDPWYLWSNYALRDLVEGRYLPDRNGFSGRWSDTYFINRPGTSRVRLAVHRMRRSIRARLRREGIR